MQPRRGFGRGGGLRPQRTIVDRRAQILCGAPNQRRGVHLRDPAMNGRGRSARALPTSWQVALVASLCAGCAVVESGPIAFEATEPGVSACVSPLGSYALPKAFVHVRVGDSDALPTPFS